ncbi:unnamed protein product [Trichogramma brassicae]|uniref:Uncharacterized protein n=1 Tax=Trichogramma brassicae TaxID=86971 RepID=A0A6H5IUW7_9HYME|nr:unnamed protein product [Trichogramma brassicae]
MAEENHEHHTTVQEIKDKLTLVKPGEDRCWELWDLMDLHEGRDDMHPLLLEVMNDTILFPSAADTNMLVQMALRHDNAIMRGWFLRHPKPHRIIFKDGRSALHFLAALLDKCRSYKVRWRTVNLMRYLVKRARKNYSDAHGYTVFHGACAAGHFRTVERFVKRGLDVNLDTWKCSPLHVAVQYRHAAIVKILLENGADPMRLDDERATPLHALARPCLCETGSGYLFCSHRKPIDEIVDALVKKGAQVEARDRHGDTPLQVAVACFDSGLVETLLARGASVDSLSRDKMFAPNFTWIQLQNYAVTLDIVEVVRLLQSAGYTMDYDARLKMLKCWMKAGGDSINYFIPIGTGEMLKVTYWEIINHLYIREKLGLFILQEDVDYLRKQIKKLKKAIPREDSYYEPFPELLEQWEIQVAKLNAIKVKGDISLYQICRMNYDEGYSILKNMKNWRLPSLDHHTDGRVLLIVKRHLANILIRPHLELFVADLFMSDRCKLNFPYTVCRNVAEKMDLEELFLRLWYEMDANDRAEIPESSCDEYEAKDDQTMIATHYLILLWIFLNIRKGLSRTLSVWLSRASEPYSRSGMCAFLSERGALQGIRIATGEGASASARPRLRRADPAQSQYAANHRQHPSARERSRTWTHSDRIITRAVSATWCAVCKHSSKVRAPLNPRIRYLSTRVNNFITGYSRDH